ncbi:MAG: endonuclease V [Desulfobacterales bacterium]|nr:endonuclease V [Desulfobacterales bacterium]
MTIVAFDVYYRKDGPASAAAIVFDDFGDRKPAAEHHTVIAAPAAYVAGAFYRRELPCILALLERIEIPPTTLIVDGYVMLGLKPGLGQHLFETLEYRTPVIGVAKSHFEGAPALEVLRGGSRRPLYVTAAGVDAAEAAENIRRMHGPHRIPTLLQRVDRLARDSAF